MSNIITAIGNEKLVKELKKYKEFNIMYSDLQYKEAIIEILEEKEKIDIIIIDLNLYGEVNDKELIKKILDKNQKTKIIYILKKEDIEFEEYCKNKNIKIIYKNKNILIKEILNCLKIKENNIKNLNNKKEEINNNNNNLNNKKEKINNNNNLNNKKEKINNDNNLNNKKERIKIVNKIINKKINEYKYNINIEENKIYSIIGPPGVGKTTILMNIATIIKNRKVLIIDADYINHDIHKILDIKSSDTEKYRNITIININNDFDKENIIKQIKKYDIVLIDFNSKINNDFFIRISNEIFLIIEENILSIDKAKKIIKNSKINNNKIKIIINKTNSKVIHEKILEKIFFENEIIGKIKYNNIYSELINTNYKKINFNKKEYIKIIEKHLII